MSIKKIRVLILSIFFSISTLTAPSVNGSPTTQITISDETANSNHQQTSALVAIFKLLAEIAGSIIRVLIDIVQAIFHFLAAFFGAIFDILSGIIGKIGDLFSWIFNQISKLFDFIFSSRDTDLTSILEDSGEYSIRGLDELTGAYRDFADTPVTAEIDVFVSIPKNETQYQKIFGEDPTPNQLNEVSTARVELEKLEKSSKVKQSLDAESIDDFLDFLEKSDSDYVTVIGHNEGGEFRFSNSDSLPLEKMAAMCVSRTKRCIFLSCESDQFFRDEAIGVRKKISYFDAIKATQKILSVIDDEKISMLALKKRIDSSVLISQNRSSIEFILATTTGTTSIAGLIIYIENDNKSKK